VPTVLVAILVAGPLGIEVGENTTPLSVVKVDGEPLALGDGAGQPDLGLEGDRAAGPVGIHD